MGFEPYAGEPDIGRLLAAFKRKKVDRVPNFEVLIEDRHVEKMLGRYAGNTLAIGGDPAKGVEESEGARPMHPADYIEVCRIIGQDALIVEAIWTPFKKRKPDGTLGLVADRSVKSRRDFEEKVIPPGDADIEDKMKYVREYRRAIDRSGTKLGFCVLTSAYFQTLYEFMIGMEDCMTMVYEDRDFIEELLEISAVYWVKFMKRAVEEGVDFVWPADDVAFKTGLFLRPNLMKEMWLPRLRRIIEPAVSAGKPVMFHSDGRIDDIVPWLLDIGVDCIQPMDPYGIDYREFKRKFGGSACLAGNIDIEFPLAHGTPADVEKDVREHMEVMKPGGGYVACSSHSIVNYIPYENFTAMINAIHKYGRYDGRQWTFSGEGAAVAGTAGAAAEAETAARGPGRAAAPKAAEPVAATAAAPTAAPTAGAAAPEKAPAAPGYRAAVKPDVLLDIFDAVFKGEHDRIKGLVEGALAGGHKPLAIVNESMTMAIKEVGDRFSTGELFLPDLLLSASTMQEAMGVLAPLLEGDSRFVSKGKVVLGTIKGDLHDIGKNMVKALLKGNGFEVVDIGIDNGPEKFVDAVKKHGPDVVGYSGLLTTTLSGIPDQMEALRKAGLRDKVLTIVGGAPVTPEFAERNGVDLYGKDANEAVKVIEKALAARKRGGTG